jgi:hypothetical protein
MGSNINETQAVTDINQETIEYIDPTIISENKMAINLFGADISELSTALNENFIRIMQTFYGEEPPINPVVGQMWFNQSDKISYRWMGENWIQLERDNTFDSFMYVMYDVEDVTEFVLDEFVFNFTIENIKLYNQDMRDVKFVIDPFDSRKIILKESNITTLYILVFHPEDRISNPFKNRKVEIFTESGQTQFDIESFLNGSDINTLSVSLNDVMMKNNEFSVTNNILTIDGMIYRVRENDKLTVWKHGGSLSSYYTTMHVTVNMRESFVRIPKFFKNIMTLEIIDLDNNTIINPIEVNELDDYFHFEFLDKKNIKINARLRII